MIRPSALQLAVDCGKAARLAEQFPETTDAAETGDEKHTAIASAIGGGPTPIAADCRAAVAYAASLVTPGVTTYGAEVKVRLEDPETGELITEGTADFVCGGTRPDISGRMESAGPRRFVHVVDWKTGRPERVTPPVDNLQLHAYGLAFALDAGAEEYDVTIGHVVDGKFWTGPTVTVRGAEMWAYLDRIKKAAAAEDEARVGGHCDSCFQQKHCSAFMLPAYEGPTALEPFTKPNGLTRDNAGRALLAVEALETAAELARERLKGFAREYGPIIEGDRQWGPVMTSGRRSGPSVKECEAAGLHHMVKEGRPIERFEWRKRQSA